MLCLNGWKTSVDPTTAYLFISGMLERGDCSINNCSPGFGIVLKNCSCCREKLVRCKEWASGPCLPKTEFDSFK